jgi:glycosyltransferase involved in cell wall biosynthesis
VVNFALGKFEDAEAAFRAALALDAHNAQAACNLGILLHQQSRLAEALPYLRQGLQSPEAAERAAAGQLLAAYPAAAIAETVPRQNILLIHEILPHYDCSGADLRLFELVREIIAQGHSLTFLARDGRDHERYAPPLRALGASVVAYDPDRLRHIGADEATAWSFRELLERQRFHVAILSHWFWSGISVPEHYLDDIRHFSPATRVLVLSEDRHGERERRSWQLTHLLSDFERGNCFEQCEMEIYERADLVLYVTETDQRHFLALQPHLQTEHLPTIAETGTPGGPFGEREGVLFLGNFENLANRDALDWLVNEIWPLVHKAAPEINLYVAGHGASPDLVKDHPEIIFLGKVPDLAPAFAARRVFAAPIRYGTGIITKSMHSLAHGLPVVTTTFGAEGMQLINATHGLISDDPQIFAENIVCLYHDEVL